MIIRVFENKQDLAQAAASQAAPAIARAIAARGVARVVAATGASQLQFLELLTQAPDIDWWRVELFQLDEYIGLPMTHPASFSKYIRERLVAETGITQYHALDGAADPAEVTTRASQAISAGPVDVSFVGIGENGHLAFNDPPADFDTQQPYIVVTLDEDCRRQQVGEGWFPDLSAVPKQAISMSIRQILRTNEIIAVVPDERKALAVKACLEGPLTPLAPASILRTHPNVTLYLDILSTSLLQPETLSRFAHAPSRASEESVTTPLLGRGD